MIQASHEEMDIRCPGGSFGAEYFWAATGKGVFFAVKLPLQLNCPR
jgi:hypothetical protein